MNPAGRFSAAGSRHVTVYIENFGDIEVAREHIARSEDGKVLLAASGLPEPLVRALDHSRDSEGPYPDPQPRSDP